MRGSGRKQEGENEIEKPRYNPSRPYFFFPSLMANTIVSPCSTFRLANVILIESRLPP